jgi:hypothetical protein
MKFTFDDLPNPNPANPLGSANPPNFADPPNVAKPEKEQWPGYRGNFVSRSRGPNPNQGKVRQAQSEVSPFLFMPGFHPF